MSLVWFCLREIIHETLILSDLVASTRPKKPSFCVTPPFQFRPFSPDDFWAAEWERERGRELLRHAKGRPFRTTDDNGENGWKGQRSWGASLGFVQLFLTVLNSSSWAIPQKVTVGGFFWLIPTQRSLPAVKCVTSIKALSKYATASCCTRPFQRAQ